MNDLGSTMDDTGLRLTRGTDVGALASGLVGWLGTRKVGPYEAPLILTPGAGMRRWLSQWIARGLDPGGEGICAGIRFEPLARLEPLLSGHDPADDAWTPERLVWRILELVDAGTPGLEPLAHHLAASEQRYANAARVSRLLDRYARLRPDMLRSWSDASSPDELGLGFDTWQACLWRSLHGLVPGPDPVRRHDALVSDLAEGRLRLEAPAVAVFCPRVMTAPDADLLAAVARRRPVDVWLRVTGPADSANPLAARLGSRGDETATLLTRRSSSAVDLPAPPRPATVLGCVQDDLARGTAPVCRHLADRTIDVHACHGPGRQAEVLREVLAGLFADDPTLEPRDVVVLCPDPVALAPHLAAVFSGEERPGSHPGLTFRVRVADRDGSADNELYRLVRDVALLPASRATAAQLLALAAHPFVARRFGFADDDAERLAELVGQASIRWGLNEAHRRSFGLDQIRQGTWQVGVQRLLLGEALSGESLASAGVIAPVDDVESSDVRLLGALAELVSRLSRLVGRAERATAAEWVEHLRSIVGQLADVPFEDSWQLGQLWGVLDLVGRRSDQSPVPLGPADALALLDAEFSQRPARPTFGDGSLVVCGLTALAQVPHRVVCLLGLDERAFPRRGLPDGDDLLSADPEPGEPDPGRDDRQAVLDAVGAAVERLVVIYQGWSSHTREHRPAPAGVVEVVEAAAACSGLRAEGPAGVVLDEPLQPFSPRLFEAPPRSFDAGALRAARALVRPRKAPVPDRYAVGRLEPTEPLTALDLDQLRAFLTHPAKYFLRERAGLTLGDEPPPSEALPLELDSLQRWQAGDRLLTLLRHGRTAAEARHAEWLRGDLPPGNLGGRILDQVTATATRVADEAAPFDAEPGELHTVDLTLSGLRVTGRVATRGDRIVDAQFSRVGARHLAGAWVRILALTTQLQRPVDAVLLGGGRRTRLSAPEPDRARALLERLAELAEEGLCRVLPLPPRVGLHWAECRARNTDPLTDRSLPDVWKMDCDVTWRAFLPPDARPWDGPAAGDPWAQQGERTLLGSLSAVVWRPIVSAQP